MEVSPPIGIYHRVKRAHTGSRMNKKPSRLGFPATANGLLAGGLLLGALLLGSWAAGTPASATAPEAAASPWIKTEQTSIRLISALGGTGN